MMAVHLTAHYLYYVEVCPLYSLIFQELLSWSGVEFNEMILWLLSFCLFLWWITFARLCMWNHPCISGWKLTWLWWVVFLTFSCIWFASILFKKFHLCSSVKLISYPHCWVFKWFGYCGSFDLEKKLGNIPSLSLLRNNLGEYWPELFFGSLVELCAKTVWLWTFFGWET